MASLGAIPPFSPPPGLPTRTSLGADGPATPSDLSARTAPLGQGFHDSAALRALAVAGGAAGTLGAGALALSGPAPGLPLDKVKHAGICFTGTLALAGMGLSPALSAGLVFAGATLGKEVVWDGLLGLGHCDPLDAAANLSGALAAYTLLSALQSSEESR